MESVINQTLTDIEILCIDAGSTDGTCQILETYAKNDRRVRLIYADKKSYGYQINLGMDMAEGEYLGIVETDDSIEPDMYEILYRTASENDLDYAKAGFYTMVTPYDGETYLLESPLGDCDRVISSQYFLEKPFSPDVYIWNGIYKLSFLRQFHVRLNESPGAAFQDCGFRYLTDMNLRRGIFLGRCLYRYRRDNADASTYNPNFAQFNLDECLYIRKRMEQDGITDQKRRAFMARETVMMALSPYTTYREHSLPDENILAALDAFREIMLRDREEGLLSQEEMLLEHWIELCLFTEEPQAYDAYISVKAKANSYIYGNFVREMAKKQELVLFGTGKTASYAMCLFRMNHLDNIKAACDNDIKKQGRKQFGLDVLAPKEAVKCFPDAHYMIANIKCPKLLRGQLEELGIRHENISEYKLPLNAFGSTNLFMRENTWKEQAR